MSTHMKFVLFCNLLVGALACFEFQEGTWTNDLADVQLTETSFILTGTGLSLSGTITNSESTDNSWLLTVELAPCEGATSQFELIHEADYQTVRIAAGPGGVCSALSSYMSIIENLQFVPCSSCVLRFCSEVPTDPENELNMCNGDNDYYISADEWSDGNGMSLMASGETDITEIVYGNADQRWQFGVSDSSMVSDNLLRVGLLFDDNDECRATPTYVTVMHTPANTDRSASIQLVLGDDDADSPSCASWNAIKGGLPFLIFGCNDCVFMQCTVSNENQDDQNDDDQDGQNDDDQAAQDDDDNLGDCDYQISDNVWLHTGMASIQINGGNDLTSIDIEVLMQGVEMSVIGTVMEVSATVENSVKVGLSFDETSFPGCSSTLSYLNLVHTPASGSTAASLAITAGEDDAYCASFASVRALLPAMQPVCVDDAGCQFDVVCSRNEFLPPSECEYLASEDLWVATGFAEMTLVGGSTLESVDIEITLQGFAMTLDARVVEESASIENVIRVGVVFAADSPFPACQDQVTYLSLTHTPASSSAAASIVLSSEEGDAYCAEFATVKGMLPLMTFRCSNPDGCVFDVCQDADRDDDENGGANGEEDGLGDAALDSASMMTGTTALLVMLATQLLV